MLKYIKEYRFYIVLVLFVLIPVVAIDTSTRAPKNYRFYDKVIISLTSPIQRAISWSLDLGVSFFQDYIYLLHTRQDNFLLFEENRKLLNSIANFRETQEENIRLRRLLHFEEEFKFESVLARVIGKDVSTEFRTIRINRGRSSGIQKNMAVVTNEGIVGRILETTSNTSDVVTILDLLSAVDAIDERSRARGVIEGFTDDECIFRYVLRTDDIQPGDVLVSGGLGGLFPKGIPVGIVSKASKEQFGITQEVKVQPSVNFSKLEEVMVIVKTLDTVKVLEPTSSSHSAQKQALQESKRRYSPGSVLGTTPGTIPGTKMDASDEEKE